MQEQPTTINDAQQPSKSISVTSLILGIVAMVLGLAAVISIPLGIAAIVTGIIAIKRHVAKGMAIAGIILGSIGVIIGLIGMLMIFIALPALQRGQRDTQVKNDLSVASSAISAYRSANQGALPTVEEFNSSRFKQEYLEGMSTEIIYVPASNCEGTTTGPTVYSVTAELEASGPYCLDS